MLDGLVSSHPGKIVDTFVAPDYSTTVLAAKMYALVSLCNIGFPWSLLTHSSFVKRHSHWQSFFVKLASTVAVLALATLGSTDPSFCLVA
jgi:hypothetical protein